ncbi:hypothetical protein ACH5RR_026475 [Cinchona calisaya]|uniref:Maturase K n=1 Tax=Cinchona calisaya TaxID=153742 RepID=A0ABD2Z3R7_9GENT
MDTLSTPALSYGKDTKQILRRLTRLWKLRRIYVEFSYYFRKFNKYPVLDFLTHPESLKIFCQSMVSHPCEFNFPLNLELSLSRFRLPWSEMSTWEDTQP